MNVKLILLSGRIELSGSKVFSCIAGKNDARRRRKGEPEFSDGFEAAFAINSLIDGGASAGDWIRLDFDTVPFGTDAPRNRLIWNRAVRPALRIPRNWPAARNKLD